jgi:hypothetical protein
MKKVLIISALVLSSVVLLAKNKVSQVISDYEAVFKQLKIKLSGITNVKISNSQLTGQVSLNITNPTTTSVGLDTNTYITLKKLLFYTESGKFIGEALPNISKIELPAQKTTRLSKIPVVVPLGSDAIGVGIELLTNSQNLQVQAIIEALNTTYTI